MFTTKLFILPALLLASPFTNGAPHCNHTSSSETDLPALQDCESLVQLIFTIGRLQLGFNQTWSRRPPAQNGQKLPAYFSYGAQNNCELFVDVIHAGLEDSFPTSEVALVGGDVVTECLTWRNYMTQTSVGYERVQPNDVVYVALRKKVYPPQDGVEDAFGAMLDEGVGPLNGSVVGWMLGAAMGKGNLNESEAT